MNRLCRLALIALLLIAAANRAAAAAGEPDLAAAKQRYAEIVAAELAQKILPGVSVAWVVDGRTVHAAGYGMADWQRGRGADAETIYRAGSISKLFNAVAAMQLVERGQLDLDAPIERALSEFHVAVPFADAGPITARQAALSSLGHDSRGARWRLSRSEPADDRGHRRQRGRMCAGEPTKLEDALFQRWPDDRRSGD